MGRDRASLGSALSYPDRDCLRELFGRRAIAQWIGIWKLKDDALMSIGVDRLLAAGKSGRGRGRILMGYAPA